MICRPTDRLRRQPPPFLFAVTVGDSLLPGVVGALSLAKTLSDLAGQERRVFRAGVVRSSNGEPSGEGAERMFASRIESTRSTPPVEPEVFDP